MSSGLKSRFNFKKIQENIVNQIDIKTIVDRYIPVQKRVGNTYFYYTPFKNERTPSFAVSPDKKIFKCFSTGVGGDVIKFVSLMEKISYEQALIRLAKEFFPEMLKDYLDENDDYSFHITLMHKLCDIFHKSFMKSDKAKDYFFSRRKLSESVYKDFFIGYVDNYRFINNFDEKEREYLSKCGILYKKDNAYYTSVYDALSLPHYDNNGNIVYISFRFINGQNSRFKNMKILDILKDIDVYYFGYYQSKYKMNREKLVAICEGQFDTMTLYDGGIPAFSIGGGNQKINRKCLDKSNIIYLAFDNDSAGYNFTVNHGIELIKAGYYVKVIDFSPYKDANDSLIAVRYNLESFKSMSKEFIEYYYKKSIVNSSKEKDYIYIKNLLSDFKEDNECIKKYLTFFIECYDNIYTGKNNVNYDELFKYYLDSLDCKYKSKYQNKDFNYMFIETIYNMIDIIQKNENIKNNVLSIMLLIDEENDDIKYMYDFLTGKTKSISNDRFSKYYNHEIEIKSKNYTEEQIMQIFSELFSYYYNERENELLKLMNN